MTNELEKKFFDTFEIKPKYTYLVTDMFYTDNSHTYGATKNDLIDYFEGKSCGRYKVIKVYKSYPQITDTHYLKLVCMLLNVLDGMDVYVNYDVEKVKEKTLRLLMTFQDDVYSQVQELFKGK